MSKYLEIKVSKKVYSIVNIKVPDDYKSGDAFKKRSLIAQACKKTLDRYDWDHDDLDADYEAEGVKEVGEEEAKTYKIWDSIENKVLELWKNKDENQK